jgi:hypothetical protein
VPRLTLIVAGTVPIKMTIGKDQPPHSRAANLTKAGINLKRNSQLDRNH